MSYRMALERLLAYEPKRLTKGWFEIFGKHCAIGAIVPASRRFGEASIAHVFRDPKAVAEIESLGLTCGEVVVMMEANDSFCGTPSDHRDGDRYLHMVEFLRKKLEIEEQDRG